MVIKKNYVKNSKSSSSESIVIEEYEINRKFVFKVYVTELSMSKIPEKVNKT